MNKDRASRVQTNLGKRGIVRRIVQTMRGFYTNNRDLRLLYKAYQALCEDLGLPQWHADYIHIRALSEGVNVYTRMLPLLSQATIEGIECGKLSAPTHFGFMRRTKVPKLLGSLLLRVFHKDGTLRHDADPYAVRSIRQFCEYVYKADFEYQPSLIQGVIDRFVDNEARLSRFKIDDDAILELANTITKEFFSSYSKAKRPRHGPGVTSNVPITDKFDYRLTPNLPVYDRFGSLYFFNDHDALDSLNRYPVQTHRTLFKDTWAAKVILVPKDSRGPRLISCEPAENQYIQQALLGWMIEHIETHPLTASFVNFTDQSVNRALALEGSITGDWATLDLKDASDLNSLDLFSKIFADTQIGEDLLSCRTPRTVLPCGRVVIMKKFAPMGSAVCFPVMAYSIFILLYTALLGLGLDPEAAKNAIRVYGDDIIVPTQYAPFLIRILERYGFIVNRSKSFINGFFKESCGGDYYKGVDVTPTRLRKIRKSGCESSNYRGLAAMNSIHGCELSMRGLYRTAEVFYTLAEKVLGALPYGTQDASYLHRHCSTLSEATLLNHDRLINDHSGIPSLVAYRISPLEEKFPISGWGHLMKVFRQLGKDLPLLKKGVFAVPRRWKLLKRVSFIG